jgi:GTP:adenosylcobinamide-phosphate guanylyltransferase
MIVVIMAGGLGIRLAEDNEIKPELVLETGRQPIQLANQESTTN